MSPTSPNAVAALADLDRGAVSAPVEADRVVRLLRSRLLPGTPPSLDLVRRALLLLLLLLTVPELARRTPRGLNILVKLVRLPDRAELADVRRLCLGGDFPELALPVQLEWTDDGPACRFASCAEMVPLAELRRDMR